MVATGFVFLAQGSESLVFFVPFFTWSCPLMSMEHLWESLNTIVKEPTDQSWPLGILQFLGDLEEAVVGWYHTSLEGVEGGVPHRSAWLKSGGPQGTSEEGD